MLVIHEEKKLVGIHGYNKQNDLFLGLDQGHMGGIFGVP